jgi:methionyl-tRNA formyltransferase
MNIVFMGTPEFAVPSLQMLYELGHEIRAVVTIPDKPVGRGLKLQSAPVKKAALAMGIPLLQPDKLTSPQFRAQLQLLDATLYVVVAFRILPAIIFELPRSGTVNLHASLLPRLRGAAPINWAIINGEHQTGVTTIFINREVDTGDIILQRGVGIGPDETAGELHDRLAVFGADVLGETVKLIDSGIFPRKPQSGDSTRAPKITREICRIDWAGSAETVRNLIRGLCPYPGAFTFWQGRLLKIYAGVHATAYPGNTGEAPGSVVKSDPKSGQIVIQTGDGLLEITELQPEGKRRMSGREFVVGYRLKPGDFLGQT